MRTDMTAGRHIQSRVADYLNGLSPGARTLLLRTLESKGEAVSDTEAKVILEATRTAVHGDGSVMPDPETVQARFFEPFLPFTVEDRFDPRQPYFVAAESLDGIWAHATRSAMPDAFRTWLNPHALRGFSTERDLEDNLGVLRDAVFGELARQREEVRGDPKKTLRFAAALGGEPVFTDLLDLLEIVRHRPQLDRLMARLPLAVQPGDAAERIAVEQTVAYVLTYPGHEAITAVAVASRCASPATLVRIGQDLAHDLAAASVRRSAGRAFVDVALSVVERSVVRYRGLRNGTDIAALVTEVLRYHEGVRGITAALDVEDDGDWRKRLSGLRRSMSDEITRDLNGAVPLIRAALTVSPDERPTAVDAAFAMRAAALLSAVRKTRDSLALHELETRVAPVMERAVEVHGERLVEQLRKSYGDLHRATVAASDTLIALTALLFGDEHAALVRKSRDNATASRPARPSFD